MIFSVPALVVFSYFVAVTSAGDVVNVINGIYSKKTVSDGICVKVTSTFQPVHPLTTTFHVSKPSSIFIHYGITFHSNGKDFYSKLQVNNFNAGSLCTQEIRHTKLQQDFGWLLSILVNIHWRYIISHQ